MGRAKLSLEVQLVVDVPEEWGRKEGSSLTYINLEELTKLLNGKSFEFDLALPIDFNADRPTLIMRGKDE